MSYVLLTKLQITSHFYVRNIVLIKELGLLSATSNTYQQVKDTLHNILQQQNNTLDSVFGLNNNDEEFNCLPCIYWLPKMHKIPSGARFTIAGKKCTNKQLSKHITPAFKLCYSQIDAYHKKNILFQWGQNLLGNTKQLPSFRMYKENQQKKKCKTNNYIRFFYTIYKDTS